VRINLGLDTGTKAERCDSENRLIFAQTHHHRRPGRRSHNTRLQPLCNCPTCRSLRSSREGSHRHAVKDGAYAKVMRGHNHMVKGPVAQKQPALLGRHSHPQAVAPHTLLDLEGLPAPAAPLCLDPLEKDPPCNPLCLAEASLFLLGARLVQTSPLPLPPGAPPHNAFLQCTTSKKMNRSVARTR
jgi:hypothetical protein